MKNYQIQPMLAAIKSIKMPKIEDKDVRNAVIKAHFFLLAKSKKLEAEIADLRTVHLGAYESDLAEVQALQLKMQQEPDPKKKQEIAEEIDNHKDLLEAINAFNKAINEKNDEELDVPMVNGEKFVEEYSKQDYDPAVVEALLPILDC